MRVRGPAGGVNTTEEGSYICSGGGSLKIITMIVTGMSEACLLIATALVCRIVFRYGNKRVKRPVRFIYSWYLAAAWLFNFCFFAGGLWYMSAIALCYGREQTDAMLMGWVMSTCISWFMMEPGFILLIVMLPCICKCARPSLAAALRSDRSLRTPRPCAGIAAWIGATIG